MGEMGRFVVAAITSTIYWQLDPSWQNADQGGPVTVTIARAPTVPAAAHLPPAPTPASLTRIEDGPEVEGRTMPLPSPFPGPVIPGPFPGSAIHEPPSLPSSSAAQRGAVESEETRHQDGPPGETLDGSMNRWYEKKGFGFVRPDGGGLDVFVHTSDIHPDDIDSIHIGAKVKFTKCWDSRKSKFKVHTINFLP